MKIRITFKKQGLSKARITRYDNSSSTLVGVLDKWRAELIADFAFNLGGRVVRHYRDGRITLEIAEDDKAEKLSIAINVAKGMRSKSRLEKILGNLEKLPEQETRLLYALIVIYGRKASRAIRELLT